MAATVVAAAVAVSTVAVVVDSTAAAAMAAVASMVEGIPTAALAVVCTEVAAATYGWAEDRHRHVVPAHRGLGRRRAEVIVTPRLAGIRLEDRETAGAWLHLAAPVWLWRTARVLPTVSGTPSEAPTVRLHRR